MRALPTGTVTFVFTDVEGSTLLIQRLGDGHRAVFEDHSKLLRDSLTAAGGIEVGERGDGFFFVFASALGAIRGVAAAQGALAAHPWPPHGEVRVRIGIHTGEGLLGGDNYIGLDVNRAARISAAGHGGETLVSGATAAVVGSALPAGLTLRDLGSHRLKDLPRPEPLLQLVVDGLPSDFPPPRALGSSPNNLPSQLTSFIGRERELAEVCGLLRETRLLTLTGAGGTGKTRLALQAAAQAAPAFPDGAFFVPVAAVADASLLPAAVLSSLGIPQSGTDPAQAVRRHLAAKRMLVVLDNFEQILAAGTQVAEWLREAPDVSALVTSRAPLRVSGEREYAVPPLELPEPSAPLEELGRSEAVSLFVTRATSARPDFGLTRENAEAVAKIAARLDGLPLAIELAAARAKLLSPAAILERLDSRLSFLTGGPRDLPARQQTLRDAIAWSYDLLEEPAKRLFRRLGVFVGGFSLADAERVCVGEDDVLDGLTVLVDHSLVRRGEAAGEPRFAMLETIRELSRKLLDGSGESEALDDRHAAAFLALAEEAAPRLVRRGRKAWLDRLEANADNLRAALGRLTERGQAGPAMRMCGALWRFWQARGRIREGLERTAAALRLPGGGGEPRDRIEALWAAGGMAYWRADTAASGAAYDEALALARGLGDRRLLAEALYNAGFPPGIRGEVELGNALLNEALALARELGDSSLEGEVLWGLGTILWYNSRHAEAEPWYDQALAVLEGSDRVFVLGWALRMRGVVRTVRGDTAAARGDLERSMRMFAADDDLSGVVLHLQDFAAIAAIEGNAARSLRLVGAAAAAEAAGETGMLEYAANKVPQLAEAAAAMGADEAEALLAEGRAMPIGQAVAYALQGAAPPEV